MPPLFDSVSRMRFAVYYAPPMSEAHWQFASRWLGRDALTGEQLAQPDVPGLTRERLNQLTASARRYGLHATLKPPFHLAAGSGLDELDAGLHTLSRSLTPFDFSLRSARLSHFIAWRPSKDKAALAHVAQACVQQLDCFRAPAADDEIAPRRKLSLSERQEHLLQRWGYPYVLDEFRFHLTLTDALADEESNLLLAFLREAGRELEEAPLRFDALYLYTQAEAGADFRVAARYGFDGARNYFKGWPK